MPSQNKPIEDRLDDVLDRIRAGMGPEPSRKAILKLFKSYATAERLEELRLLLSINHEEISGDEVRERIKELQERITQ